MYVLFVCVFRCQQRFKSLEKLKPSLETIAKSRLAQFFGVCVPSIIPGENYAQRLPAPFANILIPLAVI